MEGTSDTWKVPQIHGRYLRYIDFVRKVLKQLKHVKKTGYRM